MTRYMKWIGLAAVVLLIVCCFSPWVIIESKAITVSGMDSKGTNFGKPGYFHLIMAAFFLLFFFTPRIWAKRVNLLITGMNLAWAIRNYFLITACQGGECPEKQMALFLVLGASVLMLVAALFPDIQLPGEKK